MKKILFKTLLGEEVVLLDENIKSSSNSLLLEGVSSDEIEKIKSKVVNDSKLESKLKEVLKKEYKGTEFEKHVTAIAKNCIIQLFKQLWIKRNAWVGGISNKSN